MTANTAAGERLSDSRVDEEIEAAGRARAATVRALQQIFEVLDSRRPATHLLRSVAVDVVEQLRTMLRQPAAGTSASAGADTARLVRVHLQTHGPRRADYFGTFVRGERVRAVAGRIELQAVPARASSGLSPRSRTQVSRDQGGRRRCEERWVVVELSIV